MKTIALQQGSESWLAHRRTTRNASEAPAMMGASPHVSRSDLIRRVATGIEPEVDDATQARFDRGHAVEPALRAMAEKIIGQELYPVTGVSDDGYLGASFDGVTLAEDVIFEAKQFNASKADCMERGEIPPSDLWQIVHQFAVCATAEWCLYLVGDGTADGTRQMDISRREVEPLIEKLLAGWRQFDADVAAYQPEAAAAAAPTGRAPDQLPALRIELTGMVTESNLVQFRDHAIQVFQGISTDLQTDQDFADAEHTVRWCKDIEDRLKAAKDHALSQTESIDELFRAIDSISAEARSKRLALDKLVSRRKDEIRAEIVQRGVDAVQAHYRTINATLGEYTLPMPAGVRSDLALSIKGRKTLSSLNDAVDAAVANAKIEASQTAERVRANIAVLSEDATGHEALFADRRALVAGKESDDLRNLVKARIAEHEQREAARLEQERERIRQEESERLERERAEAEAQAMQDRRTTEQPDTPKGDDARAAAESIPTQAGAAPMPAGIKVKLGDINGWIAPLSVTAAGLAALGFKPVGHRGAAQLYAGEDFPNMCSEMARVLCDAPALAAEKQAA